MEVISIGVMKDDEFILSHKPESNRNRGGIRLSWIYLIIAIILEVSGTTCMKLSDGLTRTLPSISMFVLYGLSFGFLALALKKIDLSIAYAVWAGMGTALIATVGILWFKEPVSAAKIISLGLLIIGVIGLHLSGDVH